MLETPDTKNDSPKNGQCEACGVDLGTSFRAFALTTNTVTYPNDGRTPDQQAVMVYHDRQIKARFCSSDCLKTKLVLLLESQGLTAEAAHGRIGAGPLHPCGVCGKPVNMTQPHIAVSKGKHQAHEIVYANMLALICQSCSGPGEAVEARRPELTGTES